MSIFLLPFLPTFFWLPGIPEYGMWGRKVQETLALCGKWGLHGIDCSIKSLIKLQSTRTDKVKYPIDSQTSKVIYSLQSTDGQTRQIKQGRWFDCATNGNWHDLVPNPPPENPRTTDAQCTAAYIPLLRFSSQTKLCIPIPHITSSNGPWSTKAAIRTSLWSLVGADPDRWRGAFALAAEAHCVVLTLAAGAHCVVLALAAEAHCVVLALAARPTAWCCREAHCVRRKKNTRCRIRTLDLTEKGKEKKLLPLGGNADGRRRHFGGCVPCGLLACPLRFGLCRDDIRRDLSYAYGWGKHKICLEANQTREDVRLCNEPRLGLPPVPVTGTAVELTGSPRHGPWVARPVELLRKSYTGRDGLRDGRNGFTG
ncbi:hypothetical protein C8R47DRAFT_1062989 [Mycena vitilis]|nr:hypothetical protein C8R47DRAFT_1062989 [Mycena vitilis]